jgi:hypothetical protein
VNAFSDDLGSDGIAAVEDFFARGAAAGVLPAGVRPEFVG